MSHFTEREEGKIACITIKKNSTLAKAITLSTEVCTFADAYAIYLCTHASHAPAATPHGWERFKSELAGSALPTRQVVTSVITRKRKNELLVCFEKRVVVEP